jgi:hypothetical protein
MALTMLVAAPVIDPASLQARFDVGAGGRISPTPDVEALLARPWEDQVPMACVGEGLWAGHPSGWAFSNDTNFFLLTPQGVGFNLEFRALDQPLSPRGGRAYPSHVTLEGAVHHLRAGGAKWITEDDVLVAQVVLTNTSVHPIQVAAVAEFPAEVPGELDGRLAWQTEVGGAEVYLIADAPGFTQAEASMAPLAQFSVEGEAPSAVQGGGPEAKTGASAGAVLGTDFGSQSGDYAEWMIEVPAALSDAVLSIRYARAMPAPAAYQLTAGPLDTATTFDETGGWGTSAGHFATERYALGDLRAGTVPVRIEALGPGVNVNIDFVAIHPSSQNATQPSLGTQSRVRHMEVAGNASEVVRVCVAASADPARAAAALDRVTGLEDPLADQRAAYSNWLTANVPSFTSENAAIEKMYWHRATSVVRKNLTRPGLGRLTRWAMAGGRWHSAWHPHIHSGGAGHHLRELRWLRDPQYVQGYIDTWCENQREDGLFPSHIPPTGALPHLPGADWIAASVWDALAVHPDAERAGAWLPPLRRNIDGWLAQYDPSGSHLLTVDSHTWAGMEWQPSFFYFNGWDATQPGQALERVELSSYVHGGAKAVSRLLAASGNEAGAQQYASVADRIQRALREHCWDADTRFFYPVKPDSREKAMVKEITGVFPFYFSMFDAERMARYGEAFASVIDPAEFWTLWPVASVSRQCPAYAQDGAFHGKAGGERMGNGPAWPHANSFVLTGMGRVLRDYPASPLKLEHFQRLFMTYTMAQFQGQDLASPWTGESYHGETGEWRSADRDVNHSTYLDVIITELAGLRVRDDDILEIRPLIDEHTPGFTIDGLRYRGHDLTIAWTRWRSAQPGFDGRRGLRIYANGALIFSTRDEVMVTSIYRDMAQGFQAVVPAQP